MFIVLVLLLRVAIDISLMSYRWTLGLDPEHSGLEQTPTTRPGVPATCVNVRGLGTASPEIITPKRGSLAPSVSCRRSRASGRRREDLGGTVIICQTKNKHFERFWVAHIMD